MSKPTASPEDGLLAGQQSDQATSRQMLLQQRLAAAKDISAAAPQIPRLVQTDTSPVSFGQQRIHYLSEVYPDSSAYHLQVRCNIAGPLDTKRLITALRILVSNHEVLHSVIQSVDGVLVSTLRPDIELKVEEHNLSGLDVEAPEQFSLERIEAEQNVSFDLAHELPLRACVVRRSSETHTLVLTFHHIAVDERSVDMILRELGDRYRRHNQTLPSGSSATCRYSDFAVWQRHSSPKRETAFNYWRKKLQDAPPEIKLPTDFLYSTTTTGSGRQAHVQLSQTVAEKLTQLAVEQNVPPFVLQFAAFKVLLHRYSGQTDLVVGTPISNRTRGDLKEIVGFFVETLPLRSDLSGQPSFTKVLQQVQATLFEAFDSADSPFEEIVKAVNPDRRLGRNPLFNVMLVGQSTFKPVTLDQEVGLTATIVDSRASKFDLTMFVGDLAENRSFTIEYCTDLFRHETIECFAEHWLQLLTSIAENPDSPISTLNLFAVDHWSKSLVSQEDTPNSTPVTQKPVHVLFEERAQEFPDAVAVEFEGTSVTYWELNGQADVLARQLRRAGIQKEICVALCLSRSPEMIVAILAVLKAGGAWVPLDPSGPRHRRQQILQDSAAAVMMTQSHHADSFTSFNGKQISLDKDWQFDDHATGDDAASRGSSGDSLAYVLYTSGTTGMPKGVEVTVNNLALSTAARFEYYRNPPERFLLLSSYAFDSSIAGIFWTLCSGGTLVLPSSGLEQDVVALCKLIAEKGITHSLCLPSLYELILDHSRTGQLSTLRTMIVAGEPCSSGVAAKHCRILPNAELHNEYGPTEGTVWSTAHMITPDDGDTVPIGFAIPHTVVCVLDQNLEPVPTGGRGELFLGGPKLARRYRNQPQLTAYSFIRNPFCNDPASRLYRTGDLVRQRPDGSLEFLGRVDNQLKISGHRVEAEEIEQVIAGHPGIREVVVGLAPFTAEGTNTDVGSLATALNCLPQEEAEALVTEVEALPASSGYEDFEYRVAHTEEDVTVSIALPSEDFINTPKRSHRKWLLAQALREATADLHHLKDIAARFVPGSDQPHVPRDIQSAKLTEQEIMEDWQYPLMKAMAEYATASHGDVLEIGFGRGVSASMIQAGRVRSHTIIEANPYSVSDHFDPWRQQFPDRDIRMLEGRWQDVMDQLSDYDSIFFHTFPLNEAEFVEYIANSVTFAEHFFPTAAKLLRTGGVFTYLSTEIDSLSRRHQRSLFRYFNEIQMKVMPITVPPDTKDAWWADSMVVLKATAFAGQHDL